MPKSIKILILVIVLTTIFVPIGLYFNPTSTYSYKVRSKDNSQKEIDNKLKDMNPQEQKQYLAQVSAIESRSVLEIDDNDYIGDRVVSSDNDLSDTLYIIFSNEDSNSNKIRKIIKNYSKNKESYDYKIIYTQSEPSNLTGLNYYNKLKDTNKMGLYDVPSVFLVQNNKIVYETNNYEDILFK